ncbi:hypothetical protein BKA67DRAFT_231876 [Truncatella angustata]|uniref:F-box domain-containing protein n=1 Tax=Truncatella angustata TaxID=152316 RepID=A0A9P8UNE9_9PEZI|nr:uncharacterized protein BKA67DRAFT_231876 [Truncatella angustata]KAH6655265.1 hypothetical protein BKA67DRAFT_231876 [Truncatella angustata]
MKLLRALEPNRQQELLLSAAAQSYRPLNQTPPIGICLLLARLPLELRLAVYELLLCSSPKILISHTRRQRSSFCHFCGGAPPAHWRAQAPILQTCKQINMEATPVLYGQNHFVISFPLDKPLQLSHFFIYHVRHSTALEMRNLTFRAGYMDRDLYPAAYRCPCSTGQREWKTDGRALSKIVFPHCSRSTLRPSPKRTKEIHEIIRNRLQVDGNDKNHKGHNRARWSCSTCGHDLS